MLNIMLSHASNPDIRGGYWESKPPANNVWAGAATLSHASKLLRAWVDCYGLGGGNMARNCGEVWSDGKLVARVSYNGRVWGLDGQEITGEELTVNR